MLTVNHVLIAEGIDPEEVQLVRHQDSRLPNFGLYQTWRTNTALFEEYQRIQQTRRFKVGKLIASFVVAPRGQTLFAGLYHVDGVEMAPKGMHDPLVHVDVSGFHLYQLSPDARLEDYAGKLVVEWGGAARVWVQRATRNAKAVLEIRTQEDPPFPGFHRFAWQLDRMDDLPPAWADLLRNVKGVYVLVDMASGKQYVGSAQGEDSLLGRWVSYADGHGGNVELRRLGRRTYQAAVLEAVAFATPDRRVIDLEAGWKEKLMSRTYGLNAN
jgi:hypothetical protein